MIYMPNDTGDSLPLSLLVSGTAYDSKPRRYADNETGSLRTTELKIEYHANRFPISSENTASESN